MVSRWPDQEQLEIQAQMLFVNDSCIYCNANLLKIKGLLENYSEVLDQMMNL